MMETILLVDDENVVREAVSELLIGDGYRVVQAKDGLEALDVAQKTVPDLIILDVDLPKKNGFDVCLDLKSAAMAQLNRIPVLMISGVYKRPENSAKAFLQCKADGYLLKPFKKNELLQKIRILLKKAQR